MDDIAFENEADWGEPSDSHALDTDEIRDGVGADGVSEEDLIEVKGSVTANWRGTSGCCDQNRVDREVGAAFQRFIDEQKAAHTNLRYAYAKLGAGHGECRKWRAWPNGRRCNGSITAPASAYFYKG
jgi:hypothetical protein